MKIKRRRIMVGIVAFLLLIYLIALRFTEEVHWSLSDFTVAGVLLLGTGFLSEWALRKIDHRNYRMVAVGRYWFYCCLFGPNWPSAF